MCMPGSCPSLIWSASDDAQDRDASASLLDQVNHALHDATPLRIQGSNSKAFLGREVSGEVLDTRAHCGIVS